MVFEERRIPDLTFEGAKLVFKNFSGKETDFNRKGDRNFSVVIPDIATAVRLAEDGWNIQIRPADKDHRETMKNECHNFVERIAYIQNNGIEEDTLFHLKVNVRFDKRPPQIYHIPGMGNKPVKLDEDTVGMLDHAEIQTVDLVLNPSIWSNTRGSGITAYLKKIYVVTVEDPFASKYNLWDGEE